MQVEGQADNQSEQTKTASIDLSSELEKLKATNARLLEESRKYKERAQRIEQEYEQKSEEELSKEKDVNKVLEAERKRVEKLARENKEIKQKTLQANIFNTVSKFARDVNDLEDLLNQPRFADVLKKGIDKDNLTLDEDVAKEYVETVLSAKPYLRKQPEATTVMTKKPRYDGSSTGTKPLDQMSAKEIEETLFSLYGKK
jgi:hypothetical protein